MSGNHLVCRCPVDLQATALRTLHDGLPPDLQPALVHAIGSLRSQGESALEGLFVALESSQVIGATWAQLAAGHTAVAWLPNSACPAAQDLMRLLVDFLDQHQIALTQFLVSDEQSVEDEFCKAAGFRKLATLVYLASQRSDSPRPRPVGDLCFVPHAVAQPERLAELLLRTYVGSKDCPQLDGVRDPEDVISGYREQGQFTPEQWFFVQQAQTDVGVLLLTIHPDSGNWELVYMGLVPEARGAGLGRQIVDFALWQAEQNRAERLVLAVDEANPYALRMYEAAGFSAWDHKTVFARLRSPDTEPNKKCDEASLKSTKNIG